MSELSVLNTINIDSGKEKGLLSRLYSAAKSLPRVANHKVARTLFKYVAMPLLLWMVAKGYARADDLAAPGKEDAAATFGEDSTMMYYFMLAEVILVFLLYLRNHNPATFLLIPVFIVVTKVVYSIVASRS
ncbi:type IV conjugative transfer system pilin TraA [Entomohabitans teleogrylli]|uniref:type IV conjugative transfer system pilin TraA n=1 Tax=Entomohabitans teleogrylli TaxID=1384589 RepID=UPI00073D25B0|nr:type IV conjugative transfer system pilin TraA [Entomohabitans teleogrylli]